MIPAILLLILAGVITAALVKRPDARAATIGGLRAGAAQADIEFRKGFAASYNRYGQAQRYLTRPTASGDPPSSRNLRWWVSAAFALIGGATAIVLGGTYGLLKVLGGAVRVGRQAAEGARQGYRDYKATREIEEAEVIEEIEEAEEPDAPAPEQKPEQVIIPEDPAEEPTEMTAADLNRYDTPHERTTVNAEFTSFPQLQHDHETASDNMTQTAAAIDGQVASLLLKDMGRGELVAALMDAQETANQLAAQHRRIAELAAAQGVVTEAHAAVGGVDNVASKEAYAQG